MNNPDVLYNICSKVDNTTLRSLSRTSLWEVIKQFLDKQDFWYLRIQHLLKANLRDRPTSDWKSVYQVLERSNRRFNVELSSEQLDSNGSRVWQRMHQARISLNEREVLDNSLAVEVLLEVGEDPSVNNNEVIVLSSGRGIAGTVKLLLADPRVDPTVEDNEAIRVASEYGRTEVMKLLLADPRVDPTVLDNHPIGVAAENGQVEAVKLLLADPRVDPSGNSNYTINISSSNGYSEVVKLLLAHPRIDLTRDNNYTIRLASKKGHIDVVKLLLADKRIDPTAHNNRAIILAHDSKHIDILRLLLTDPCVDLRLIPEDIIRTALIHIRNKSLLHSRASDWHVSDYDSDYYYIFLGELLLKKGQDLKYFLTWLLEQCTRHAYALEYRQVIAEAARSYSEIGKVVHTSSMFTAYSGFLLLAKTSNKKLILDLLKSEGATQRGLELATVLLDAYLE